MSDDRLIRKLIVYVIAITVTILIFDAVYSLIITDSNPLKGHDLYAGPPEASFFIRDWYLGAYSILFSHFYLLFAITINKYIFHLPIIVYWKFFAIFVYLVSFLTMFTCMYLISDNVLISAVAALLYLLNPFHLSESIIEAHFRLSIFIALVPLAFTVLELYYRWFRSSNIRQRLAITLILSLVLTAINYTHPQAVVIFYPSFILFAVIRIVLSNIRERHIRSMVVKILVEILSLIVIPIMFSIIGSLAYFLPIMLYGRYMYYAPYPVIVSYIFSSPLTSTFLIHPMSDCVPQIVKFFNDPMTLFSSLIFVVPLFLTATFIRSIESRDRIFVVSLLIVYLVDIALAFGPVAKPSLYIALMKTFPLFRIIRTPGRFLVNVIFIISSLWAIVLKYIKNKRKLITISILLVILLVLSSYHTISASFQDYKLPKDVQKLYTFLSNLESSARILPIPIDTWIHSSTWRNIVNPLVWTFEFHKEVVSGGAPNFATIWVGDYLTYLYRILNTHKYNISTFLYLYNVKYIVLNKTNIESRHLVVNSGNIERIFESGIFEVLKNKKLTGSTFLLAQNITPLSIVNVTLLSFCCNAKVLNVSRNTIQVLISEYHGLYSAFCVKLKLDAKDVDSPKGIDSIFLKYSIEGIQNCRSLGYTLQLHTSTGKLTISIPIVYSCKGYIDIPIGLFYRNTSAIGKISALTLCVTSLFEYNPPITLRISLTNISLIHNRVVRIKYVELNHGNEYVSTIRCSLLKQLIKRSDRVALVVNYAYMPMWKAYLLYNGYQTKLSHIRVLYFLNGFIVPKSIVNSLPCSDGNTIRVVVQYSIPYIMLMSYVTSAVTILLLTITSILLVLRFKR